MPRTGCGECTLRRIAPTDAADCDRYRADVDVTRYTSIDAAQEPAAAAIVYLARAFAEKREIRWAIASKSSGVMLGDCGYHEINEAHACAEIGYVLSREYWGRGIATAAVRAMLDWGFETLGLHRIEVIIHPDNAGSLRVAEKAGFRIEGVLRGRTLIRSAFQDMLMYSVLADEWSRRR